MAIVKQSISNQIRVFLEKNTIEEDTAKAKKQFADDLAEVIESALKSAIVQIEPGKVLVATAGSATNQTGSNTNLVIGSLK